MKILFVINDGNARRLEYEYTGIFNAPNRRSVEIELSEAQLTQLGIKKIGTDKGNAVYETIESISTICKSKDYE
jgi:hypothetical protein